jgi:hypothetical protein
MHERQITAAAPINRAVNRGQRLSRPALTLLAGAAGVGIVLAITSSMATASAHPAAGSAKAPSGVILCAKKSGELTVAKKTSCPRGDRKLSVGDQSQVTKLTSQVKALTSEVTALKTLTTGLTRSKVAGHETLTIAKENVQIVNGTRSETDLNGLGNLIIGYNDNSESEVRTGSHNLVVGDDNGYSSYGGIVAGILDSISGPDSAVLGGTGNGAQAPNSTIVGGKFNITTGALASILGGYQGTVSTNDCSSIPTNPDTNPLKC